MEALNDNYGLENQYIKWVIRLLDKRYGTNITGIGVKNRLKPVGKEIPSSCLMLTWTFLKKPLYLRGNIGIRMRLNMDKRTDIQLASAV